MKRKEARVNRVTNPIFCLHILIDAVNHFQGNKRGDKRATEAKNKIESIHYENRSVLYIFLLFIFKPHLTEKKNEKQILSQSTIFDNLFSS